jgi:hypothetical protein
MTVGASSAAIWAKGAPQSMFDANYAAELQFQTRLKRKV